MDGSQRFACSSEGQVFTGPTCDWSLYLRVTLASVVTPLKMTTYTSLVAAPEEGGTEAPLDADACSPAASSNGFSSCVAMLLALSHACQGISALPLPLLPSTGAGAESCGSPAHSIHPRTPPASARWHPKKMWPPAVAVTHRTDGDPPMDANEVRARQSK